MVGLACVCVSVCDVILFRHVSRDSVYSRTQLKRPQQQLVKLTAAAAQGTTFIALNFWFETLRLRKTVAWYTCSALKDSQAARDGKTPEGSTLQRTQL